MSRASGGGRWEKCGAWPPKGCSSPPSPSPHGALHWLPPGRMVACTAMGGTGQEARVGSDATCGASRRWPRGGQGRGRPAAARGASALFPQSTAAACAAGPGTHLPREDEGRAALQLRHRRLQLLRVRVLRHLQRLLAAPALRAPGASAGALRGRHRARAQRLAGPGRHPGPGPLHAAPGQLCARQRVGAHPGTKREATCWEMHPGDDPRARGSLAFAKQR